VQTAILKHQENDNTNRNSMGNYANPHAPFSPLTPVNTPNKNNSNINNRKDILKSMFQNVYNTFRIMWYKVVAPVISVIKGVLCMIPLLVLGSHVLCVFCMFC